jgi:probable F420-dependent oxidoreductase
MDARSPTLSIGLPNFGGWIGADWSGLLDLARAADDAGVDRIIVNDHVVMGRNTDAYVWGRFPTGPDAPWLEPFTCLAAIAAVTSQVRLGTGIVIAPLRPAAVLAKTVATLDVLSAGRVDLGVGVGWQKEEYDAEGLDFATRGQRLDDTMGACRALWSQLPASYKSETVCFDDIFCSPQPVQKPLPVWFSGTLNARQQRRIVELGDGWIPIMGATVDDISVGAKQLRRDAGLEIGVRAPLRPVLGDGGIDLGATMEGVPTLLAAGATDIYLYAATIAPKPADVVRALPGVVDAFREASR